MAVIMELVFEVVKSSLTYHCVGSSEQHFSKTLAFKYAFTRDSVIAAMFILCQIYCMLIG